jgi:hypothetical protein
MDSGMIGKIQKSRLYAEEPERFRFDQFQVTLQGTNAEHKVSYDQGRWSCTCNFFAARGVGSHTMALEPLLGVMLPPEAVTPQKEVSPVEAPHEMA